MDKIKTLAIAPYNGLKDLINDIASEMKELEVHTFVGDMLEGVELVKSIQQEDYDVIISRAGTADLIREVTEIPVIDLKLSIIDMMRAIKLAQNYTGKFVIVGYKAITEAANVICQLNDYVIEIKTISSISEIDDCLNDLKQNGVSLIVGDVITITHAKRIGLNAILVTSGRESVLNTFVDLIKLNKHLVTTQRKYLLLKKILENSTSETMICFNMNKVVFSNFKEDDNENNFELLRELRSLIDVLIKEKEITIMKTIDGNLVKIKGKLLVLNEAVHSTFYIEKQTPAIKPFDNALVYKNISEYPQVNFDSFPTSSIIFKKLINDAKAYSKMQTPVILFGDNGTGKDTLAHAIYQNSNYNKNPLIIINSKYMNEKKWISIFESENSPFVNRDYTIYIKNLHYLDEASQKLLESYIINTYVHKRNRFIFTCINGYSKTFDNSNLLYFIRNELSAFPLVMPSLNQRKEDIPSLASLFLSDFILKYGKQVLGLENDALKLLEDFQWTHNINQLKRVIEELITLTDTFYINAETVKNVLSHENLPKSHSYIHFIDLNKTLDQINKDILDLVLTEENFNQSKAAERLGISRSTLWRKIK